MELTVGYLKKVLELVDDDVVLANLEYGNNEFEAFNQVKRLILLKDISHKGREWGGKMYLTINGMGSHFTKEGDQRHFTVIRHFDDETFN